MPKTRRNEPDQDEEPVRKRRRSSSSDNSPAAAADEANKQEDTSSEIGFTLKVADNHVIQVSKSESEQLQDSCAFFRNAFRHGTLECQNHIISKPDWTVETASAILELIQKQSLAVPENYAALKEAADQILLPLRVLHPVSGSNIANDLDLVQSMSDTYKAATTTFTLDMSIWNAAHRRRTTNTSLNPIWEELLLAGTVFVDADNNSNNGLSIQLIPENGVAATPATPANVLQVGTFCPLSIGVYHACARLSESLRNPRNRRETANQNKPACMALPLYCGGKQVLEDQFPEIEFLLIETNNVPTVNMTRVTAESSRLREVVEAASELIAPVNLTKLCYLLIPEPSVQLLGKLITACQQCVDDPGTLGWDLEKNQFCTLKTLRDTKLILDCLLDDNTKMAMEGTIQLVNVDMTAAPEWSSY